jgi:hypothetical protein
MEAIVDNQALYQRQSLAIVVSPKTKYLYQKSEVAVSGKGPLASTVRGREGIDFFGIPVVESFGFPENAILATYMDVDPMGSNLHVGLRNAQDDLTVDFDKKANGSQAWFFRMDYAIGTQVGVPADVIYYGPNNG